MRTKLFTTLNKGDENSLDTDCGLITYKNCYTALEKNPKTEHIGEY